MPVLKKIPGKYLRLIWMTCCMLLFTAQTSDTREYKIKAAFLFNFSQFVEWPNQSFSSPQAPAVIGILGTDPFGSYLEETIKGESINKHPLIIKKYTTVEEVSDCHILFINSGNKSKMETILAKLKGKPVLTVSDASNFAKMGGMIRLFTKDDKIKMQINLEAAKAENIVISSKLLKLAEIVTTK